MTPRQLLEDAVARFVVCYISDPAELERLLRQALGKFQDRAGVILESWGDEAAFSLAPDFHAVAGCSDSMRRYIPWRIGKDSEGHAVVTLILGKEHEPPYCLAYFCNLRDWEMDTPLPGDCDALVCDYLEVLISIKNVKREREAYLATNMVEAAQGLPTEQDLRARLADLEKEMLENKAVSPPASMF